MSPVNIVNNFPNLGLAHQGRHENAMQFCEKKDELFAKQNAHREGHNISHSILSAVFIFVGSGVTTYRFATAVE